MAIYAPFNIDEDIEENLNQLPEEKVTSQHHSLKEN